MKTICIAGSRNQDGHTARALHAISDGLRQSEGDLESIFLPRIHLEHCRQCNNDGWGLCRSDGRCVIDDFFSDIVARIRLADMIVFATPVYYGDLSESLRAFTDRLRRICAFKEQSREGIKGKPAIGICVAGGSGGGSPSCCAHLDKVLCDCGFKVIDMVPVRRQNIETKLAQLHIAGSTPAECQELKGVLHA
jgi:multimeric flavodoxin WrbA